MNKTQSRHPSLEPVLNRASIDSIKSLARICAEAEHHNGPAEVGSKHEKGGSSAADSVTPFRGGGGKSDIKLRKSNLQFENAVAAVQQQIHGSSAAAQQSNATAYNHMGRPSTNNNNQEYTA